ncbi:hypothetical protein SAMN06295912_12524 [Sphingomonas laterariae]|uniref:O-Antigen ligase n=1 Tax=Edaphosphingomonas laterariae TaxID=861865 RepID=A0A239IK19_9SPHN|nr:hypothetical protein [Sphingomonas laterariae]SNS93990.1 hypothetical protein SAMN06295912_12524 [Sphingomonas laterariae]
MSLTIIGIIQLAIGVLLLLFGQLRSMFLFLLLSGLFGGSASLLLPALGGSSMPPVQFALMFVYARLLLPGGGQLSKISDAFRANVVLALFTLYGVAAAFVAPRIFAGAINVTPLRPAQWVGGLFYVEPLQPSSQNITSAVYLVTTLLGAVAAYVVCRGRGGADMLVRGGVICAWIHGASGVIEAATRGTPVSAVFEFVRNANYSQVQQTVGQFIRINGFLPEPAAYAAVGFTWFVFTSECWYRSIRPRSTGAAAMMLGLILFFSTSSSAYVALAAYAAFFVLRLIISPHQLDSRRLGQVGMIALAGVLATALAMAMSPQVMAAIGDMVSDMTVGKGQSESGEQRLFWAMQGWHAFLASGGLGVGPGSFRSSSLLMAILGSMGVIGIGSFAFYLGVVLQPMRASTWKPVTDPATAISAAAGCTAVLTLIPPMFTSLTAVPGMDFAIFAGAALALRPALEAHRRHPRIVRRAAISEAGASPDGTLSSASPR